MKEELIDVTSCGKAYRLDDEGLWYLEGYYELTDEQRKSICNGIGAASGVSKKFPNTVWGLNCKTAGDRHDYSYYVGGTANDRYLADKYFYLNLSILVHRGCWLLLPFRMDRIRKYYIALRVFGGFHFGTKDDGDIVSDSEAKQEIKELDNAE